MIDFAVKVTMANFAVFLQVLACFLERPFVGNLATRPHITLRVIVATSALLLSDAVLVRRTLDISALPILALSGVFALPPIFPLLSSIFNVFTGLLGVPPIQLRVFFGLLSIRNHLLLRINPREFVFE